MVVLDQSCPDLGGVMRHRRPADRVSASSRPVPSRVVRRAWDAAATGGLAALALAVALAFTALPTAAQATGRITGVVTDSSGGAPLAGVQLLLAPTGERTAQRLEARTDADGRYAFNVVPAGSYTMEARRLGYRMLSRSGVAVAAGATVTINLSMAPAALSLQAVVTTGAVDPASGTRVPFTVGRVTAEDAPVPAMNALETIQGKIAGVTIVPPGQAGSGTNIQLRTPTSINKSNTPLLVVDGVILTDAFGGSSADLQSMDIESVEVVKGAAAASLYGARAASGVINIRTRRGSGIGEGTTKFSVRSEMGSNSLPQTVRWAQYHYYLVNDAGDWVDAQGNVVSRDLRVPKPAFERFQDSPYKAGTVFDQVDRFFDPGNFHQNSLNIAQNGGKTNWYASFVNRREDGVVLNAGRYDQNDVRLNLDHRPRSDLSVSVSAYHMRSRRQNLYGDTFFDLINQAPDIDLRKPDPDGTPFAFQQDPEGREENPLYVLSTEENIRLRARTQGSVEARCTPFSWLTLDGLLSYDRSDRRTNFFLGQGIKTEGFGEGGPGEISQFTGTTDAFNYITSANLLHKVGDFTVRGTVRGLFERETNQTTTASGNTFSSPGVKSLNNAQNRFVTSNETQIRTNSLVLSTAADYKGLIIVDTTRTARAEAMGKFIQGISHGYIGLYFDKGVVIDEDTDLEALRFPDDFKPYPEMVQAAIAQIDEAIAIAQRHQLSFPADGWLFTSLNSQQFIRVANSFVARLLAYTPRSREERAAVDWDEVIRRVDAGITTDFAPIAQPEILFDDWKRLVARLRTAGRPSDFGRPAYWLIGPADSTNGFVNWAATPVADRQPFQMRTRDRRIQGAGGPATPGSYVGYNLNNIFAVSRGTYRFSWYYYLRNGTGTTWQTGPQVAMTVAEMDLLKAEALIRRGRASEAVPLINKTRLANGQLPEVTIDGPPDQPGCVPRKLNGQCGSLWDALRYEKGIEGLGVSGVIRFFDARGWRMLAEHSITQLPIPGLELGTLRLPNYTFGGPGGQSSAPAPDPERCPVALARCQ
jgi:TonB-dependent SusC/RagA subfamily outer membrane receptor